MQLDPATIVRDPAWLPHYYDLNRVAVGFAYLPREYRSRPVFLDQRFLRAATISPLIPVSTMPLDEIAQAAGPMHYIFHTAFCCSTLLARALEYPGVAASLREPLVLLAFGQKWDQLSSDPTHRHALSTVLDLMARPLAAGEHQIAKPTNTANLIAPSVLELKPQAKAILLYSDLDDYLVSIASQGEARGVWGRAMFRQFHRAFPLNGAPAEAAETLPYLEAAAHAWLKQIVLLDQVARRFGPGRVRTLNSASFIAQKAETLSRASAFFGLQRSAADWPGVASGPLFGRHAKQMTRPFSETERHTQHAALRATHSAEISAALESTRALAADRGLPLTLGDTLLNDPL